MPTNNCRLKAGEHTCFGHFDASQAGEGDDASLEKPVMLVYCGEFESMDGPVTVDEEKLSRLVSNHNSRLSKIKRLATGEIPLKACPPLQVDHSTSALMTVGRVVGDLSLGEFHDDESGKTVKAAFGKVRVLGKENVEKVRDGRWVHVSVGADLEQGTLNELSITPFPAAANASLLSSKKGVEMANGEKVIERYKGCEIRSYYNAGNTVRYRVYENGHVIADDLISIRAAKETIDEMSGGLSNGGSQVKEKLKAALMSIFKLSSDKDADDKAEKLKAHLMEKEKLSAEDAEKKLAEMDEEGTSKLAAEVDEKEKLAANPPANPDLDKQEKDEPEHKAEVDKLAAAEAEKTRLAAGDKKAEFVKLAKGFKAQASLARLEARKATIGSRLSALRSSAKITPAEVKKIDVARLALENDATMEAVLKSYESREPVIMAGVYGTAKAMTAPELASRLSMANLEAETRANMPSKSKLSGAPGKGSKRLSSLDEQPQAAPVAAPAAAVGGSHYDVAYAELCKLIDSGDTQSAKAALKAFLDQMKGGGENAGAGSPQEAQVQMSALVESVKTMHNHLEALVQLVGPNLGVTSADIE